MGHGIRSRGGAVVTVLLALAVGATAGPGASSAVTTTGVVVTAIGSGTAGYAGDGGLAVAAALRGPRGLAVRGSDVLVADTGNHVVRRVDGDGVVTTIAGTGTAGQGGDGGDPTSAQLHAPRDVAVRPNGDVVIADTGNHRVRIVPASGSIDTLAGSGTAGPGGDGGPADAATLSSPSGVAIAPNGRVVIADTGNHRVRLVDAGGHITTLGGTGVAGYDGDGGPAVDAAFWAPEGVAVLPNGTTYVADTGNHRIRRIDHHGVVTTVAGTGTPGRAGDGGPAVDAQLHAPTSVAVLADGSVLVGDTGNHVVRLVGPDGTIATVMGTGTAGTTPDGAAPSATALDSPAGVVEGPDGALWVAEAGGHRVRRVEARPAAPTLTGVVPAGPANDNRPVVRGHAAPGTTVHLHADAACTGSVLASGPAVALGAGLAITVEDDTATEVFARSVDTSGVASACSTSSVTYVEDSTAPPAPRIVAAPASPSAAGRVTWRWESAAGSVRCVARRGSVVVADAAPCPSPWEVPLGGQPDGIVVVEVVAVDGAGNASPPATGHLERDTTPPGAPSVRLLPPTAGFEDRPLWTFRAEAGATTTCRLTARGSAPAAWATCASPWSTIVDPTTADRWRLEVRATDLAGNTGPLTASTYRVPAVVGPTEDDPVDDTAVLGPGTSPSAPTATPVPEPEPRPEPSSAPREPATPAGPTRTPDTGEVAPAVAAPEVPRPRPAPTTTSRPAGDDGPGRLEPPRPTVARAAGTQRPEPGGGLASLAVAASRAVAAHSDEAAFPVALLLLVLGFLGLQDRVDRRDPKLADAPVAEPDHAFPVRAVHVVGHGRAVAHHVPGPTPGGRA